ncbi:unnamed protein product [Nezara viridula]|uniref:Uncharacterized protein n=1 Tax=Nezara viridula TaxID=85310 RepID=A0A9P0HNH7_NEZVI|nr:unnamed protein product [Nezara viridula]
MRETLEGLSPQLAEYRVIPEGTNLINHSGCISVGSLRSKSGANSVLKVLALQLVLTVRRSSSISRERSSELRVSSRCHRRNEGGGCGLGHWIELRNIVTGTEQNLITVTSFCIK